MNGKRAIYEAIAGFHNGLTLKGKPILYTTRRAAELTPWAANL